MAKQSSSSIVTISRGGFPTRFPGSFGVGPLPSRKASCRRKRAAKLDTPIANAKAAFEKASAVREAATCALGLTYELAEGRPGVGFDAIATCANVLKANADCGQAKAAEIKAKDHYNALVALRDEKLSGGETRWAA